MLNALRGSTTCLFIRPRLNRGSPTFKSFGLGIQLLKTLKGFNVGDRGCQPMENVCPKSNNPEWRFHSYLCLI